MSCCTARAHGLRTQVWISHESWGSRADLASSDRWTSGVLSELHRLIASAGAHPIACQALAGRRHRKRVRVWETRSSIPPHQTLHVWLLVLMFTSLVGLRLRGCGTPHPPQGRPLQLSRSLGDDVKCRWPPHKVEEGCKQPAACAAALRSQAQHLAAGAQLAAPAP
jgi:hypothetical protein